ncbi:MULTISPECIES: hypothetical protein [Vibrio]|uniref:KfrA N-terminal DNA-binding domain-containing protein n=1 Tax=Vibrio casei TaxID=673372 RepID=A0A368LLL4_9VIBR|nr:MULTISPECIES: hypothetical protein [Vibrio]RCS72772.1 hypothetical protein CIK83_03650 [Vibrio casei]SJN39287.1 hypothetical protein FM109_16315 [Vibrio casei]HBV74930.1 hypothetical protein [Vibrio sp.]
MQTQNVTEELHNVLSAITAEGKEPSVALVKSRLSMSVPMPAIIKTIKSWKSSNKVPKVEIASPGQSFSSEERIVQLEQQVKNLTERLIRLERTSI